MSTGTSGAAYAPPMYAPSRVYNALLGGREHYGREQELAQGLLECLPGLGKAMQESRRFIRRAAAYLADSGIRQFIDLGCGYPADGSPDDQNVHEVVQDASFAYVDADPTVISHMLRATQLQPNVTTVDADVRDVGHLLSHPKLLTVIDPDQEVGVLAGGLLHHLDDEAAKHMLWNLGRKLAPGSVIALTCATGDGAPETSTAKARDLYERHVGPLDLRSGMQLRALMKDSRLRPLTGLHRTYELLPAHPDDVVNVDKTGPHLWAAIAALAPVLPATPR
ncbi:SAM-dependent methyltransferase [Nonomuraea sp. NPDC005650]|uniref:SAM-dependent methyltransferase n=1 Tax=Nonomuraea sp. NPDC005650 TaxID=3157045 RepID=UPI0033BA1EF7